MKAVFNGVTLAESDDTVEVDGAHYFPRASVDESRLRESQHTSFCGWKGDCSYYHVEVDGQRAENACWYYAEPYKAAAQVKDRVAFWKGVEVLPST